MTRVLIVDDKEEGLYFLRVLLRGHGCDVDEARHGAEALVKARLATPDLIVTDLLMPVMDGYTLLRRCKADALLRGIPLVVYTATYTDPRDEQLALELGADAFILKPAEPDVFMVRIHGLLAGGPVRKRTAPPPPVAEEDILKLYSEALVRKLEKKALELEEANRDLAAREARLRAILENELDGVVLLAVDGSLLHINPAGLRMLEADAPAQVENSLLEAFIAEEHRVGFRRLLERVMGGESGVLQFQVGGLKGGSRWIEAHAGPLRDASGAVTAVLGIMRDVSERRRGEADLREAKERLLLAVTAGKVGLWDWDLRTNKVRYSSQWKQQIGYGDDEISDDFSEWQSRVHPDDLDSVLEALQAFLSSDARDLKSAFRFRHKNGTYRHILARASEVRSGDGTRVRLVGSTVDITESMELQSQLMRAQRMESVGQLAGGLAHDFNNLLTVIIGTVDLVLMRLLEADPLTAELGDIRQAADRAASLTHQLLAFSRRQVMKPETLDLSEVVDGMQAMLRRVIGENVELLLQPAGPLGATRADRGQIEQVILNLAINARDAMPYGGTLSIETRDVQLDQAYVADHPSTRPGAHVMLVVSDTGVGMDEKTRARIFEPFFTTKGPGKGTGLGLSTVYGIVKQSGGSIWVASEPGKRTTFTIYLPRVEEAARKAEPAPAATREHGAETILVVEDDVSVRNLAKRVLQGVGYLVLAAGSGEEALLLLERHRGPVHLVLTDIVMPGMSGRDLATRLATPHPGMRFLYTSGYAEDAVLRPEQFDQDAQFLSKPYTLAELTRKVREVLDSPAGVHPAH
ncbi:MAG: response regulator [Planctomycetes bacterium]|nr:response regulator [Planctomycetota bacterium]